MRSWRVAGSRAMRIDKVVCPKEMVNADSDTVQLGAVLEMFIK